MDLRALVVFLSLCPAAALGADLIEPPFFQEALRYGALDPLSERIPSRPAVFTPAAEQRLGRYGGDLRLLMARARDTRILYVYSYARLIRLTPELDLQADILENYTVQEERVFTFFLRPGHRWSDGRPFTTEDFRYWWEEMANNPDLRPFGPPADLLLDSRPPQVTILDRYTIRYAWDEPNPNFLFYLAGARPEEIYAPAHYLKQFNPRYADPDLLQSKIEAAGQQTWAQLHNKRDNLNRFDNPDLPTLQPWQVTNRAPTTRFVFERNPYYHRVDEQGRQLPYIDRVIVTLADSKIIPAKTGSGESDLQARYLRFDDYTFLKQGEKRNAYRVHLWRTGSGSHIALFPNLTVQDPLWRDLIRDRRFRRALSLGINREEINQVLYYGLAIPSNNTVIDLSPLYRETYRTSWAKYDLDQSNRLLDSLGLERNFWGVRLLPNGQPMDLIVETAGESTEETDILELIKESWRKLGIRLFTKPLQREVLRNRIYSGQTVLSIGSGLDNGIPLPRMSPKDFIPTAQVHYQWPRWGQYYQTKGQAGQEPDMPEVRDLLRLFDQWRKTSLLDIKTDLWHQILYNHSDNQWTIGIITGVSQPVIVHTALRNVPRSAIYNYEPGAHFGLYTPEIFWWDTE